MEPVCVRLEFASHCLVSRIVLPTKAQRQRESSMDALPFDCISSCWADLVGAYVLQFGFGVCASTDCDVVFGKTNSTDQERLASRVPCMPCGDSSVYRLD